MESKKILLVEDESITAMDIAWNLKAMGHTVVGTVDNGPEAIEFAAQSNPDLLIMDINLKGEMTGIEAFIEIQKTASIPAVFVTGYHFSQILKEEFSVAIEYVSKPFDSNSLEYAIETIFSEN